MGVSADETVAFSTEKKSLLGNFDFKAMLSKKPKVDLSQAD
jgi:hypothetical protein